MNLLTVKEAASILNVSTSTVRKLAQRGCIESFHPDGLRAVRYLSDSIEAYIKRNTYRGRVEIPSTRYKPGDKLV